MNSYAKRPAFFILIIMIVACLYPSAPLRAEEKALPESVSALLNASPAKIGNGTYRKLGFRIYDVTLWASQSPWDSTKPYALQVCYSRSLSKETLVDAIMEDISDQGVADEATLTRWKDVLNASLSDVKEGDALIGLALPGEKTLLFYNGLDVASVDDQTFSKAFFGIWLGERADEDLRRKLFGGS
jgi:hypothetical protein